MKTNFTLLLGILFLLSYNVSAQDCPESFHDFSALDITGVELNMSDFAGKKVLVVNTASFCGYTNQYATLQQLYSEYGGEDNGYNFEIIGFPANNFGNQEPYDEEYISGVCESYGVTFTMMSKISVAGSDQHEIYGWLTQQSRNCVQNAPVQWNFQKFLVNEDGSWHDSKGTTVSPMHSSIIDWITTPSSAETISTSNEEKFFVHVNNQTKDFHLNIQSQNVTDIEIRIWSVTGQLVDVIHSGMLNKNLKLRYNASHLHAGMYIVEVTGNNIHHHRKVMVY